MAKKHFTSETRSSSKKSPFKHPERPQRQPHLQRHPHFKPPEYAPFPKTEEEWFFCCRELIKRRMREHGYSYEQLHQKLADGQIPRPVTATALKNRINRGRFSASLLLRLCYIMGMDWLDLQEAIIPPNNHG